MSDRERERCPWRYAIGVALLPFAVLSALAWFCFRRTLLDVGPAYSNDETYYWLQIRAFAATGFESGYYVIDERPAAAPFSPYGPHGPMYPMLYGMIGRLMGWGAASTAIVHVVLLTLCLACFLRCYTPRGRLPLAGACLATFWPALMFLPTAMQEGLHYALATILAAVFASLLRRPARYGTLACGAATLTLATLLRPSWLILWPPLSVLAARTAKQRVAALGLSAIVGCGLLALYAWTAAPFPDGGFLFLKVLSGKASLLELWDTTATNVRRLLFRGTPLERVQRGIALAFCVASSLRALRLPPGWHRREAWFHAYNLGITLSAAVTLYVIGNWGDYRLLGVGTFLSLLLCLASDSRWSRWAVTLTVAAHLVAGPFFAATFRGIRAPHFLRDETAETAFRAVLGPHVSFRPGDPWCNTLLSTTFPFFHPVLAGLPAGIGVAAMFSPGGLSFPARSAYVLFDPDRYAQQTWMGRREGTFRIDRQDDGATVTFEPGQALRLRLLAETPLGGLYRNLDARCPPLRSDD
jgi:hypothetical protein